MIIEHERRDPKLPTHWPREDRMLISMLAELDVLTEHQIQDTNPFRIALDTARAVHGAR